jgi:DNA-damage-inducible protein J
MRNKTGIIHIRVDEDLKARAENVLREVGVSTTNVVTMLLHQIVLRRGIPFDVSNPNTENAGKGKKRTGAR